MLSATRPSPVQLSSQLHPRDRLTLLASQARGGSRRITAAQKPALAVRLKRAVTQALVIVGSLLVIAGAGQGAVYLLGLPVDRIAVTGSAREVTEQSVGELVAPYIADGLLRANLDAMRHELEALPWVYSASVRRRWPDTLAIHIEEQRPIARWGDAGFLNHEGEFFAGETSDAWVHLPRLEGSEGAQQRLVDRYQTIEAMLADSGLGVVRLTEDPIGQVSITLDTGTELVLGNEDIIARMQRFVRLHQDYLAEQRIVRVDLRYRHGAAVELAEPQFATYQSRPEERL